MYGREAEVILNSTGASDEEKDYATVLLKFDEFFKVRQNVIYKRAHFNCCSQLEGESTEQFIMGLNRLAGNCDYKTLRDEMIRDRLVVGIWDQRLSERMQLDATLNLEKAKKMACQHEAIHNQSRHLTAGNTTVLESMSASKYNKPKTGGRPERQGDKRTYTRCGKEAHQRQQKCPAMAATCHNCQKKGHYCQQCFFRKDSARSLSEFEEQDLDSLFLHTITINTGGVSWKTEVQLEGKRVTFKVDTGVPFPKILTKISVQ